MWSALLALVFQEQYPDLLAGAQGWLCSKYSTTDCFAVLASAFQLAHYLQDMTPDVASALTLGDLCGAFEVFMAVLFTTEREHRRSSE
jgi:hypothetical protein